MNEQEPVGDDNYGDYIDKLMSKGTTDKHLTIVEGQHGEIHFDISKKQEPPTVEFRPNIVTKPTVPPETQRTLHNGMVALVVLGLILLAQVGVQIWGGLSSASRDRAFIDELKELNAEVQRVRTPPVHAEDSENGAIPVPPKRHP